MVAALAVYLFAVEILTMQTTPRRFLVLHHTNDKLQFKTACLGPDQCHRGRLEISVVSSSPDMLTMNVRDVIIGYHEDTTKTTYYMKTDPHKHHIVPTTVRDNATTFQMIINTAHKEHQITFLDTSTNRTMVALPQYDSEGNEVDCAVGDLKLVNMTGVANHEKHKLKKTKFVLYDHSHKQYFNSNPECC